MIVGNIGIATGGIGVRHGSIAKEESMAYRDEVNIEEAVQLHYRRIYHFSLHLSRNPDDAADLTQHAYEMLATKIHTISDISKVKSWLHTTVYRKFIDQRRRSQRFPSVELGEEHLSDSAHMNRGEIHLDAEVALKALHQLDDDLRAPLSLFYLENYTYKEIAEALAIPAGTVMSRLYRGKKCLYESITGEVS